MDKKTGQIVNSKMKYLTDAFFVFHHINTYEDSGKYKLLLNVFTRYCSFFYSFHLPLPFGKRHNVIVIVSVAPFVFVSWLLLLQFFIKIFISISVDTWRHRR